MMSIRTDLIRPESVASISYLENGVSDALQMVPAEKLVAGVPFLHGCGSRRRRRKMNWPGKPERKLHSILIR